LIVNDLVSQDLEHAHALCDAPEQVLFVRPQRGEKLKIL
jgi:hypothetical protein